jgi:hypothetical protein
MGDSSPSLLSTTLSPEPWSKARTNTAQLINTSSAPAQLRMKQGKKSKLQDEIDRMKKSKQTADDNDQFDVGYQLGQKIKVAFSCYVRCSLRFQKLEAQVKDC